MLPVVATQIDNNGSRVCSVHNRLERLLALWWMIEFAGLAELASAMFQVVLANGLIGTDREHGLAGIDWASQASATLHV